MGRGKLVKKSNPVLLDKLPENAKAVVIKKEIVINKNVSGTAKYSKYKKQRFIQFYDGYDFLQNFIVVRQYVQKRYKIDLNLLEILLYLFPMQYFTRDDYKIIPRNYGYRKISDLVRAGYVNIAVTGKNQGEHLYTLNRQGTEIVKIFYESLAGERKIPEQPQKNPMALKTANKITKKQMDLIKVLNQKEVPQTRKAMFE